MPVMDGREFRNQQRRDPKLADIPVVVLTAAGNLVRQALPAGDCIELRPLTVLIITADPGVRSTPGGTFCAIARPSVLIISKGKLELKSAVVLSRNK